jgi:hypothetical protein
MDTDPVAPRAGMPLDEVSDGNPTGGITTTRVGDFNVTSGSLGTFATGQGPDGRPDPSMLVPTNMIYTAPVVSPATIIPAIQDAVNAADGQSLEQLLDDATFLGKLLMVTSPTLGARPGTVTAQGALLPREAIVQTLTEAVQAETLETVLTSPDFKELAWLFLQDWLKETKAAARLATVATEDAVATEEDAQVAVIYFRVEDSVKMAEAMKAAYASLAEQVPAPEADSPNMTAEQFKFGIDMILEPVRNSPNKGGVVGLVLPVPVSELFAKNLVSALKAANIETVAVRGKMDTALARQVNEVTQNPPASLKEWMRPGKTVIPTAVLDSQFEITKIARIFGITIDQEGIQGDPLALEQANLLAVTLAILLGQAMAGKEITKDKLTEAAIAELKQEVVSQLTAFDQAILAGTTGITVVAKTLRGLVAAEKARQEVRKAA